MTEPIRTKQGYVILKVVEHVQGGVPPLKDVENDVEQNYFEAKAGPAMREYLAQHARRVCHLHQARIRR